MIQRTELSNELQPYWNTYRNLQQFLTPFSSYEWHTLYFQTIGENIKQYMLLLPHLRIIAPFEQNLHEILFSGGKEICDYMDLIGPEENIEKAWDEILLFIKNNDCTALRLPNVSINSGTYAYFLKNSQKNKNITLKQEDTTPILTLPNTFHEFLSSLNPKHAHEAARKIRKFERENKNITFTDSCDDAAMDTAIQLMKLDQRKTVFFTTPYEKFFRSLVRSFDNSLHIHIISVEKTPVSAIIGFSVNSHFFLYNSGFDQANGNGAGFYLKVKNIEWAINNGYTQYNFLQGNERYKYELGGVDSNIYSITYTW